MRVVIKQRVIGSVRSFEPGQVVDLPEAMAVKLVKHNLATVPGGAALPATSPAIGPRPRETEGGHVG